ncbi:MAG: aminopeptidase P N-terminal domain-containing protein [Burkholderiaceae bacterium]|nr:aminopeptidase P N-terminal domain-containing protein [Burkholderiaceae bacterium]
MQTMNVSLYAARRARLAAQLGPDAVAIVPTASEYGRNRDNPFAFRPDSYFFYLTGFDEPQAWLVLDSAGRSTLFCAPKNMEREIWDGYRLGTAAAPDALGVDEAFSIETLDEHLPRLLENRAALWYPFATHKGLESRIDGWLAAVRARARARVTCPDTQRDLCSLLDEMRLVKDAHELSTMRAAACISARAHARAMRTCARMVRAGQEVREYHLEAELLHEFRFGGAQSAAFGSIVAAGANACVLHYRAGAERVRAGELVLIDAGCELDNYAGDISRTFPASGKFSGPQRALYELVWAGQNAAVAAIGAGVRFDDPHEATVAVLAQGLLDLGLLDANKVGSAADVIEQRAYTPFYMHRTSHWLGMDVHDCGSYVEPVQGARSTQSAPGGAGAAARPSRILRPGMVLTVEPGLYVRPAEGVPERFWNIGIRIEDDALVTETGCELMTRDVPVAPDDIEALMRD